MSLNAKILCYLTDDADQAVAQLMAVGFDQDLALSVLEQLWPEDAVYELPDEDECSGYVGAYCSKAR